MITSKKNPRLQFLRSLLQDNKTRDESGQFVIEGVRLVEDAVNQKANLYEIYFSSVLSERGKVIVESLSEKGVPVEEVSDEVFHAVMDTSNSQGLAAICGKPDVILNQNLDFVIVADQLRDPGNLGTLLRTAASAGAQAVITTPDSVDLYSPKVLRSGMGAHFHISCIELDWESIKNIKQQNSGSVLTAYVAAADGDLVSWDARFTRPSMLIIGSEADGVSQTALDLADHQVSIPMPGKMESLNAAIAAGILIYEVVRQRSTQSNTNNGEEK